MDTTWDAAKVKSQIRLTSYRLTQLQERHDQTSHITKRDIATLIGQRDVDAARLKVERLIKDDRLMALIEALQSYCNTLLERFAELERSTPADFASDSPVIEAVFGLILAAPRMELKDLMTMREILERKYGPEFTQFATQNHGRRVPLYILDTLNKRCPSSAQVDAYMVSIAKVYQIAWTPPMLPHQKAHALSEILDIATSPRIVNLEELRRLCCQGIPLQPRWLRPRVWKLLLGYLSPQKDSWETDSHTKRQSYYQLAHRRLTVMRAMPPPVVPLAPLDVTLLNLRRSLSSLPPELDVELECSPLCPFDDNAPEGLRIDVAGAVDHRLSLVHRRLVGADMACPPDIRLDVTVEAPSLRISISSPAVSPVDDINRPDLILDPSSLTKSHATSILRLLYVHISLHPSSPTAHLTSILVPLYVTMTQDIEPEELAHVEADTFWLFAELWAEMGDLVENGDCQAWLIKLGSRLASADPELWDDLSRKGLDPALPHYSYRWLTPLLTRTLSLQSVLTIWDALFARPPQTHNHNFKLEFLLDICTSMLIRARVRLFCLGNASSKSPGLWGDIETMVASSSSKPAEFAEGFAQGMALLQNYPMEEFGGAERVIDIALGLARRRERPEKQLKSTYNLGERLRTSMWSGFMGKSIPADPPSGEEPDKISEGTPSPEWPDSGAEDGDVTETQGGAILRKIGGTVWRGITNKSSMDVPPSPPTPSSPLGLVDQLPSTDYATSGPVSLGNRIGNSIWRGLTDQSVTDGIPTLLDSVTSTSLRSGKEGTSSQKLPSGLRIYADKLKDSDAAATLSKTSSNWTARTVALWARNKPLSTVSSPEIRHNSSSGSQNLTNSDWADLPPRRGSLPDDLSKEYSPPTRLSFRESKYYSPREHSVSGSPPRSVIKLPSSPNILTKSKSALASLAGATQASARKTGPRPLLLNSSSLITPSNPRRRGPSPTLRHHTPQRDSISSISSSSTSPSGMRQIFHSDRESDPGLVPLRRGAPVQASPSYRPGMTRSIARSGRSQFLASRNNSEAASSSSATTSSRTHERRTSSRESARRGWGQVELPDSPSTLLSSTPPMTPNTRINGSGVRVNSDIANQEGILGRGDTRESLQAIGMEKRVVRKKSWNSTVVQYAGEVENDRDSSTSQEPENRSHSRSKRHGRPTNLRLKSDPDLRRASSAVNDQKSHGEGTTLMPETNSDATFTTPRAIDFPSPVKFGHENRIHQESYSPKRPSRTYAKESGGEEGDDEGYDEFLSTYESEDNIPAQAA